MKICAVYRITNTITGDFYIGSSKNVKERLAAHKCQSTWNNHPNSPMYLDMQKYGVDKFEFQIIEEVEEASLKEAEQQFIQTLKPTYNQMNAKGWNVERYKEYQKEYEKSKKGKESHRKAKKKYQNQLCCFNGEILTLCALSTRFRRAGIEQSTAEAKKYLLNK